MSTVRFAKNRSVEPGIKRKKFVELIILLIAGAAALTIGGFAVFDGNGDDDQNSELSEDEIESDPIESDPSEHAEAAEGRLLTLGGAEILNATEGDDTIVSGFADDSQRVFAPSDSELDLLGGDDLVNLKGVTGVVVNGGDGDDQINVGDFSTVQGGSGDDTITTGWDSSVEGGSGNDTITVRGGTITFGGDGDDLITLNDPPTQFENGIDGGAGNDTIEVNAYAGRYFNSGLGTNYNFIVATGDGSDSVNLNVEILEEFVSDDSFIASYEFLPDFLGEVVDFDPLQDQLRLEISRSGDTTDRAVNIGFSTPATGGDPYLLTLDVAATATAPAFQTSIEIFTSGPLNSGDIEITDRDEAARSITVTS